MVMFVLISKEISVDKTNICGVLEEEAGKWRRNFSFESH
jgi:hypothetical protein